MKTIFIFCVILFAPSIFFAQAENKEAQWTKIESPKGDLSFAVPPNFLVDNEAEGYGLIAYQDEVIIGVNIQETGSAKSRLKAQRQLPPATNTKSQISRFTLGDFIGDVYKFEKERGFSMSIYAASSKAFYVIFVTSKDAESPVLDNFLYSIKLDNKSLLKQTVQPNQTAEETKISIASLKTSLIVLEALKSKDADKTKLTYNLKEKELPEDNAKYSRPLIMLRKPRASYTDRARQERIQGTVKLKVLFRANGEVGDISVLSQLTNDLTGNAADVARKIKFLPAEIDGKAVDIYRVVEYSFTIY